VCRGAQQQDDDADNYQCGHYADMPSALATAVNR
jgi:hypothetical protein